MPQPAASSHVVDVSGRSVPAVDAPLAMGRGRFDALPGLPRRTLVLGAYSHSWLKQLIFGGVTRTVLHTMPVTAFLSR